MADLTCSTESSLSANYEKCNLILAKQAFKTSKPYSGDFKPTPGNLILFLIFFWPDFPGVILVFLPFPSSQLIVHFHFYVSQIELDLLATKANKSKDTQHFVLIFAKHTPLSLAAFYVWPAATLLVINCGCGGRFLRLYAPCQPLIRHDFHSLSFFYEHELTFSKIDQVHSKCL